MDAKRTIIGILVGLVLMAAPAPVALAQNDFAPKHIDDPLFEVRTVVPESWHPIGGGLYARGEPPDDLALLAVQSAAVTPEQLWESLRPQLGLDAVPAVTGSHSSDHLEWTLSRFDPKQAGVAVSVEVAMAEEGGRTYLLLLQATPDEFAALREAVLVPALESTEPLEAEPTHDPSSFDYRIEDVAFPGGSPGVELAGTLTLPNGPGPHPVVVLLTGSGAQDRDESLKPITTLKPFALIADALTSNGVGVLRYDDRGVGGSTGDYTAATVEELASDGRAAIDYLETRPDVDARRIGILGHSEGGMYAAMLGASDPRVAFIVGMAPVVVDGVDLLIAQNEALTRAAGAPEVEVAEAKAFAEAAMPAARDGDVEAVEVAVSEYAGAQWDRMDGDQRALAGDRATFVQRQVDAQMQIMTSDWFRSLLAYDAEQDWARITVPVLGLFGAKDVQVVSEQNEPALRAALESAGNGDFETVVLPDANHLFQAATTGAFTEYATLDPVFTPTFLPTLIDWVTQRVNGAE